MKLVKILAAAAALCAAAQAGAVVVTKTFSGAIDHTSFNQPELYAIGTTFTGSFTYDTASPIAYDGPNYNEFAMANGQFTLTINGESYANANLHPNVKDYFGSVAFGEFQVETWGIAGNGALNGLAAALFFQYSQDADIANQALPTVFPTDFQTYQLRLFTVGSGVFQTGAFTIDADGPATHPVPEPAMLGLFGLGALGLGLSRRRKA